jgi:prephenate dehydrogenase
MQRVAIVGVGLIGGSFGLALRKRGFAGEIVGVSSQATIQDALRRHAIDRADSLEGACLTADLVLLATPISRILELLPRVLEFSRGAALVTDAGSTKRAIAQCAASCRARARFVGGHPMAGKATQGVKAADADLFTGRRWIVCAESRNDAVDELFTWIERVGAEPVLMTAEEHDRIVSAASHLPQMLSTTLASLLAGRNDAAQIAAAAGPGLADMTRLAKSSAAIWRDILDTNRDEILQRIDEFNAELTRIRGLVEGGEIEPLFSQAAKLASLVRGPRND